MDSFFKNIEAKNRALGLYDQKLESLNKAYERITVETSFGNTHIIITGNPAGPTMVLLHGSNGCAPIAIDALIGLTKNYRIHAIDVVGQPNLSEEFRPDLHDHSYGQWMYEILSRLNISNAVLVGISFGGFISWKTLTLDEKRIAKTFFIAPAGIINDTPFTALRKVSLPVKEYRRRSNNQHLTCFLDSFFSEQDAFVNNFFSNLFLHYEMDFSPIPLIKKEKAASIKTPVYFIGAENDLLFPGQKLLARAKKIFPSLQGTLLLKKSKHVPNKSDNRRIIEFIKKHSK